VGCRHKIGTKPHPTSRSSPKQGTTCTSNNIKQQNWSQNAVLYLGFATPTQFNHYGKLTLVKNLNAELILGIAPKLPTTCNSSNIKQFQLLLERLQVAHIQMLGYASNHFFIFTILSVS
jgi:hypothetical protein